MNGQKRSFFLRDNHEADRVRRHLLNYHPRMRFTISPNGQGPGPFGGTGPGHSGNGQGWEIWGSPRVIDLARALVEMDPEWTRHIHAKHEAHQEYEQSLGALKSLIRGTAKPEGGAM